ncbi:MAG: twin-arginine translocation signal domain-containing protein, partial [Bacteroidetes bacterium]|nr:twin-arginine translocation signal domain-containing protein [Bacteroidota bacterium]
MTKRDNENVHLMNSSRREFIRKAGTAVAGLLVVPYLRPSGVFAYDHKQTASFPATVAISNTTNTPANGYAYDDAGGGVKQKVRYLLELLDQNQSGKVSALFAKGKKVAIKINLTGGSGNASNPKLGGYMMT